MKKMLMMSLLLCGSFSLFGMDYKKLAQSVLMGATAGALAPVLISPSLPKQLMKEKPEAYMSMILFGGMLGIGYELLSCPSKPMKLNNKSKSIPYLSKVEFPKQQTLFVPINDMDRIITE